ncbi:MAG: PRC-barrel domain containing protein [Candidatus Abyssobacteria bacterium SURF_5]|uniref:PRC-barrel domain containing protein n=1 Tax=Abyssobacteria bacterium (strain SURF_5) TaxID=2093360 RepID=A0A3A4NJA0_ABYX5|nr:MAG: PRC-barrel domain containing protein [Candidatus Abyssubacteria bacterium SURF_5]
MKAFNIIATIAFVISLFLTAGAFEKEAVAWGLPEGFNPETGRIEKTSEVYKTEELIGSVARNERGERLGMVEEILFSDDGRIEYLVLARDEIEGAERLVPVPWKDAKAEMKDGRLVLSLDKSKFDNAPSFGRNDWQRLDDPEWNREVHSYY